MRLFPSILGEIIIAEVEASNGTASTRVTTARYSSKSSDIILREIGHEKEKWPKRKHGIALLLVRGSDVGTKEFATSDNDGVKKITENENLLWTVHEENDFSAIDFIRKSSVENILNALRDRNLHIMEITVSPHSDIDLRTTLLDLYEKKLNFEHLKKSKEFCAFFFDSLFDKIKLPFLLFFFVLLFVNYIAFSNIKEKYEISETAYNIRLQKSKQERENTEKANRLFSEYDKIRSYPLALLSDRIASYMPRDIRLVSMVFFPENRSNAGARAVKNNANLIIVKGKAEIAGTVLLFAQYLQEDKLFSKVDIININNLKDNGSYDFELHIIL